MPRNEYHVMVSADVELGPELTRLAQLLNRHLLSIGQRLDHIERIDLPTPLTPQSLAVEGKQGLFHITWRKVKDVDGYVLMMGTDSVMSKVIGRFELRGSEWVQYQVPVGNVAVTRYFQIYSFVGKKHSLPSAIVSATSVSYGAGESAPAAPPQDPQGPTSAPPGRVVI